MKWKFIPFHLLVVVSLLTFPPSAGAAGAPINALTTAEQYLLGGSGSLCSSFFVDFGFGDVKLVSAIHCQTRRHARTDLAPMELYTNAETDDVEVVSFSRHLTLKMKDATGIPSRDLLFWSAPENWYQKTFFRNASHVYRIATSAPRQGEIISLIGYPDGTGPSTATCQYGGPTIADAKEIGIRGSTFYSGLLVNCPKGSVSDGNSGGPALNSDGEIIGVVSAIIRGSSFVVVSPLREGIKEALRPEGPGAFSFEGVLAVQGSGQLLSARFQGCRDKRGFVNKDVYVKLLDGPFGQLDLVINPSGYNYKATAADISKFTTCP